jgi:hypothetical protein
MLRNLVISILNTRAASSTHTSHAAPNPDSDDDESLLGKNWTYQFVKRHSDRIKVYLSSPLDSKRGRAVNPNTNAAWFKILGDITEKYNIEEDCLYGSDETGFQNGMSQRQYVIGGSGKKQQHKQQESISYETITAVVTICANGTSIPPLVIFKGKAFSVKWAENNPLKASYVHTQIL